MNSLALAFAVALITIGVLGAVSHLFVPDGVDSDNLLPISLVALLAGAVLAVVVVLRY